MDADKVARELEAIGPRLPAMAAVSLSRWQTLTARAERARNLRGFGLARALYEDAIEQADALLLLAHQLPTVEVTWLAPVLYELSCRHVVQLARQLKDADAEGIFLYRAFERLVQVGEQQNAPVTLRSSCVGLLPEVLAALVPYLGQHGPEGLAAHHSARMVAAVRDVQRAAKVAREQQALLETGVRSLHGVLPAPALEARAGQRR